ncbi:MAG: peptidoglycan bridge formation glycyltransferase FemA/FemB family protein [Eubacteriales bacterium]|nr:peptidoglycan bridge formation glycyltransferase FemA/FemB family protein [Eubacteriales bacterium]
MQQIKNKRNQYIVIREKQDQDSSVDANPAASFKLEFKKFIDSCTEPVAFLQAYEMGEVFRLQGIQYARFMVKSREEEEPLATAVVRYYPKFRLFKEAWITHGPVFKSGLSSAEIAAISAALRQEIFREAKVISMLLTPYYNYEQFSDLPKMMEAENFKDEGRELDMTNVNHLYIKNLDDYQDIEEIVASYSGNLRRAITKSDYYGVRIKDLPDSELSHFFKILEDTAERKEFFIQEESYFRAMRKAFGKRAKLMLGQLDLEHYRKVQKAEKAELEAELEENKQKTGKRARGKEKECAERIKAVTRRLDEAGEYPSDQNLVDLCALFCVEFGGEITTVFGGRYRRFNAVEGNSILNHRLLEEAFDKAYKRFNFYGTLEIEEAKQGIGNYEFKKSFAGETIILVGKFTAEKGPAKILARLKK